MLMFKFFVDIKMNIIKTKILNLSVFKLVIIYNNTLNKNAL